MRIQAFLWYLFKINLATVNYYNFKSVVKLNLRSLEQSNTS